MPTSFTEAEYGEVVGDWVIADYQSRFPGNVPAKSLVGEVIAYPDTHAYLLTDTAMVGEIDVQSQVVNRHNSTIQFFLAPGYWVLEFRLYNARADQSCQPWMRQPHKHMQVALEVRAGETYTLDSILRGDYGNANDVEWYRKADGSLWLTGPGVSRTGDTVILSGSGYHAGADGTVIVEKEKA